MAQCSRFKQIWRKSCQRAAFSFPAGSCASAGIRTHRRRRHIAPRGYRMAVRSYIALPQGNLSRAHRMHPIRVCANNAATVAFPSGVPPRLQRAAKSDEESRFVQHKRCPPHPPQTVPLPRWGRLWSYIRPNPRTNPASLPSPTGFHLGFAELPNRMRRAVGADVRSKLH